MKKIEDKYTDLPISRERKRQLRNKDKGLCACGKERVSEYYCPKCLIKHRKQIQNRKLKNIEKGLCPCGKERISKLYCSKCLINHRKRMRKNKVKTKTSGRKPLIPDDYESR